jgi:hypothetical protein
MNQPLDVLQSLGEQFERLGREPAGKRERFRFRWHRRAVIGLAVALVCATGATAAVTLTRDSSPPVSMYSGALCPANYPVLAVASPTKIVYPSDYPQRSIRNAQRVICFVTLKDAVAAGYKIAATPAGDTKLGPLYMQRAPHSVREACRTAARELRATVYCPTRLPAPWLNPAVNYDCPTSGCPVPVLSLSGSFVAPASYVGSAPGTGDVTIWQGTRGQERTFPYLAACRGAHARLIRHTVFRGDQAAWYQCEIFGATTSSMLEWRHGAESYGVTADGPAKLRQRIVDYIAKHMVAQSAP